MFLEAWSGAILPFADFACRTRRSIIPPPPSLPFLDAYGRDEDVGRNDPFFSIVITGKRLFVIGETDVSLFLEEVEEDISVVKIGL